MSDLDKRIADVEKELADLRRRKLAELQSEMAALQASIGAATTTAAPAAARVAAAVPAKKGRPAAKASSSSKGWVAALQSDPEFATVTPGKKRGRKRGKHVSDTEALAVLTKVVAAAGKEGISARQAALKANVFYPRAITLMDDNFKKSGLGKWTRYTVK